MSNAGWIFTNTYSVSFLHFYTPCWLLLKVVTAWYYSGLSDVTADWSISSEILQQEATDCYQTKLWKSPCARQEEEIVAWRQTYNNSCHAHSQVSALCLLNLKKKEKKKYSHDIWASNCQKAILGENSWSWSWERVKRKYLDSQMCDCWTSYWNLCQCMNWYTIFQVNHNQQVFFILL